MSESAQEARTSVTDPPVVNGFARLNQAPQISQVPPPADSSRPAVERKDEPRQEESAQISREPRLLPEYALLGSLLHAPAAVEQLEAFLGVRDFSRPDTRAVYATLRGLHKSGLLFDVATLPTEAERLHAANENQLRLFAALRARPPLYTSIAVADVPEVVGRLNAAAPAAALPYRGVYDSSAQLGLGRMVLEDSCRRQLTAMRVLFRRPTPLVLPTQNSARRAERTAHAMAANLDQLHVQLGSLAQRLTQAVHRTPQTSVPDQAVRGAAARGANLRLPSGPLRRRAELHILHLALHAGRMQEIPDELLKLAPEDFSTKEHANLWRTMIDLRQRGLPVNYVSVFREAHAEGFAHGPMLSDRALTRLAEPPSFQPGRIARSLHTVLTAAIARTSRDVRTALNAAATNPALDAALTQTASRVAELAGRARTVAQQHRLANTHLAQERSTR
jgi:DnaB-like helicase N terminal domain